MPPNRVVHQLLTGRKRKPQSVGSSTRVCSNNNDNESHKNGAENSRLKVLSSTFPLHLLSKTSLPKHDRKQHHIQTQYKNRNSERELISSPSKKQIRSQNIHDVAPGMKVMVATNKVATESLLPPKQGKHAVKAKPEASGEPLPIFPDYSACQRQDAKQQPQEYPNANQHWLRNRYRRRYQKRKKQRQNGGFGNGKGIETPCNDVDVNSTANDDDSADHEQLRRLESLAATRQIRQRSRKSESYSNTAPYASKNYNATFAEVLVRTFLEQRHHEKKLTSPNSLSSSWSSLFDDPMLFPLLLLGVSVLCRVMEWYDQKREEAEFSQSRIVRDLVLWMKDQQELHTAYTSETIVEEHVDASSRLAKFQVSIEDSHQTSLRLLSRQREEEIEENQHNQKRVSFEAESAAQVQMKMKTGAADTTTNISILGKSKVHTRIFDTIRPQSKKDPGNIAGNKETSKSYDDYTVRAIDEAESFTDDPVSASPRNHRPKSRGPNKRVSNQSFVEESKNDGRVEHDNDDQDSRNPDSSSDNMRKILLSQSPRFLPKPRRVTASPRILSDNKAWNRREQYKHYSKINFLGQNQNGGDRRVEDIDFDYPSGKVKRRKRNISRKQLSPVSSQKTWVSRAPKRSPSFKQTSLTSSTCGWVSNQRARNFVKNERSPIIPAMVRTNSTSDVPYGKGYGTSQTEDFYIQNADDKARSPFCNVTTRRNDGFGRPTTKIHDISSFTNDAQKIPNKDFPTQKFSTLEQKNPTSCHTKEERGFQARSLSKTDISNESKIFDISSKGAQKNGKNNDVANSYRYEEVVRGKVAREELIGYECEECAAFFDEAVLLGDGAKYYDRDELLRCSRHRARHTPPQTPEDYWELSFMDEKAERLKQDAEKPN